MGFLENSRRVPEVFQLKGFVFHLTNQGPRIGIQRDPGDLRGYREVSGEFQVASGGLRDVSVGLRRVL